MPGLTPQAPELLHIRSIEKDARAQKFIGGVKSYTVDVFRLAGQREIRGLLDDGSGRFFLSALSASHQRHRATSGREPWMVAALIQMPLIRTRFSFSGLPPSAIEDERHRLPHGRGSVTNCLIPVLFL